MFHKKNLFGIIIFLLAGNLCFSQSKTIRNLQLDFKRVETTSDGQSFVISGNLLFKNNPYTFIFDILSPEEQTTFINSDGCFFKDNTGLYDFEEGKEVLNQTCKDILTWFKKDMGLTDSGYKPISSSIQEGSYVTVWGIAADGNYPIREVHVTTDTNGVFKRLRMYLADGSLFTDTELSDFIFNTGFYFPTKIVSKSYSNGKLNITTELSFKNIFFNQLTDPTAKYSGESITPTPTDEATGVKNKPVLAKSPKSETFRVSLASVMVNFAYTGYKKYITKQDASACPFTPSCSQYMLQAVTQNGMWGLIQGLERLDRCNATEHRTNNYLTSENGKHIDLVPPKRSKKKK